MQKTITIRGVLSVLLLLMPIINQYKVLPVTFIYLFLAFVLFCSLFLARKGTGFLIRKPIYYCYVIIVSVILMSLESKTAVSYIFVRLLYFSMVFLVFYCFPEKVFDYKKLVNAYIVISLLVSIAILLQILLSFAGIRIALIIPNLTANTGTLDSTNIMIAAQKANRRFSSFFLEPAHQSQYVMPAVVILLFSKEKRNNRIIYAVLITIGIIATTSLQGILGIGIIWFAYFLTMIKKKTIKSWITVIVLIVAAVIIVSFALRQSVIQEQITKKVSSFNSGDIVRGTSMYRRILYGWECFGNYDWSHILFGCGYDNSGLYLRETGIGLQYVSYEEAGYMSGMSKIFCELGIIGALLNLSFVIIPAMKARTKLARAMLLCWLIIMLTSANFDQLMGLIPMYLIISERTLTEQRKKMILSDTACETLYAST